VLIALALTGIWTALLRPQWGKKEEQVYREGRNVVIALDISKSMLAQDMQPNRLEYAKEKIKKLTRLLKTDRVALVLFAGSSFIYCPLTDDHAAFISFLDTIDSNMVASGTTNLSGALEKALAIFERTLDSTNKLVIIVTDGEDFSPNLSLLKEQAQKQEVKLFTLGVGTPKGAPVPLIDEFGNQQGHQKDAQGSIVISRRNDSLLRSLSQESGALYIPGTSDDTDLAQLSAAVQQFERERFGERKVDFLQERYMYFAGAAALCLGLEWLL
jgi:Ca-activated chloride channel family protein